MYKLPVAIAGLALLVGGCSTTSTKPTDRIVPESDVVIVDPESMDRELNGTVDYKPTPDHVVVGDKDGIIIEVKKAEVVKDENAGNIELQVWKAKATNTTSTSKCVTPMWRLMDFEFISNGPSEQLVKAYSVTHLGDMQQKTWIIDGVRVAPPPSGYLADLRIRDVVKGAKSGEECMYLIDEEDILDEDDVTDEEDIKDY